MTLYSSFRKTGYGDLPSYAYDKTPRKLGTPDSHLYDWYIKSLGIDPTSKDIDRPELEKRFDVVRSIYSHPDLYGMALFLAGQHPIGMMDRAKEDGPMERVLYALSPKIADDNQSVSYEPQEIGSWPLEKDAQGLYDLLKGSGEITPELAESLTPVYKYLNYPYIHENPHFAPFADRLARSLTPTALISRGYTVTDFDSVDNPKISTPRVSVDGSEEGVKGTEGSDTKKLEDSKIPASTRTRKTGKKNKLETGSEQTPEDEGKPFTESASDLFVKMRAARKNRKSPVTDDTGNVDIVKSSTSSLFKSRMKGSRQW